MSKIKGTPTGQEGTGSRTGTSKRGGDLDPMGDQSPAFTGRRRGTMPKDSGGPPTPDFGMASRKPGDPMKVTLKDTTVEPIPTRRTPHNQYASTDSTDNPIK